MINLLKKCDLLENICELYPPCQEGINEQTNGIIGKLYKKVTIIFLIIMDKLNKSKMKWIMQQWFVAWKLINESTTYFKNKKI